MINYTLIAKAIEYYKEMEYQYVDVPWVVDETTSQITKPPGLKEFPFKNKVLVASGEQSFLQMIIDNGLMPGKYVCVTPCFRDESKFNKFTKQYFLKVELINTQYHDEFALWSMIWKCLDFYRRFNIEVEAIETDQGIDIISNGIELGSYGIRYHEKVGHWVYGTGLAEPRFSAVLGELV